MAEAAPLQGTEIDEDDESDDALSPKYDIVVSPVDYPLDALYRKLDSLEIILPEFQRRYVWDRNRASRLIESFLMGLPVPPVFLLEQRDHRMLVIDGLQRLRTVQGFFSERFGDYADGRRAQAFKLVGVSTEGQLHGKTFSGLDMDDRRALENAVLRAIVIRQMHPDDNPVVAHDLFERLNTGGMNLRNQEVRHCIYSGKLNDLINELNGNEKWRGLIGSPRQDGRMKDAELILRYIALLHDDEVYKKPMKNFLSAFMHKNRDPPDAFIGKERERFLRTCDILRNNLGRLPLNNNNRISPSVFDSIFVTVARNPGACDDQGLSTRLQTLLSNPSFVECNSHAPTDSSSIRMRLSLAKDVLCR